MIAFEVYLNETKITTAGLNLGVLTSILTYQKKNNKKDAGHETLELHVGGLNTEDNRHYSWYDKPLSYNDEIRFKIVSCENVDTPYRISEKTSQEFLIEEKLKYFYRLQEELKELKEELKDYLK